MSSSVFDRAQAPILGRNRIINGGFDLWQRGTSQTSSGYGSADRWRPSFIGSTVEVSRQEFSIIDSEKLEGNPTYFCRTEFTSANTSNSFVSIIQRIENVRTFSNKTVTLSFWAKADQSINIRTEVYQQFGSGGSSGVTEIGVTSYNITTEWRKFFTTFNIPSVSGKTINANNQVVPVFWFEAGSDYDSRLNSLGNQSGIIDIANVQLEEGTIATPFEVLPITMVEQLCYRYYYASGIREVTTGGYINSSGSRAAYMPIHYPVRMRVQPDLTRIDDGGVSSYQSVGFTQTGGDNTWGFYVDYVGDSSGNKFYGASYIADAEL